MLGSRTMRSRPRNVLRSYSFLALLVLLCWLALWNLNTPASGTISTVDFEQGTPIREESKLIPAPSVQVEETQSPSKLVTCPSLHPVPPSDRGNVVQLASYPGSGNTWIRTLIQKGTGYWTGSAYNDAALKEAFPGEGIKDSSTIVVKSHFPCENCWPMRRKKQVVRSPSGRIQYRPIRTTGDVKSAVGTVYILRNPFDAVLSEFHRVASGFNHTGKASAAAFEGEFWEEFAVRRAKSWKANADFYMSSTGDTLLDSESEAVSESSLDRTRMFRDIRNRPVYLIDYDKLQDNYETEMKQVLESIRVFHRNRISMPEIDTSLHCSVLGSRRFKRQASRVNPYSDTLIATICSVVESVWQKSWGEKCDGKLKWERLAT